MEYNRREFKVKSPEGDLSVLLKYPLGNYDKTKILLLSFAMGRFMSLDVSPYNIAAQTLLKSGHNVLSFDIPNHGDRIDGYGEGINGMRDAFLSGDDPFKKFTKDASRVIDFCLAQGLAVEDKIAVCGTSRAGYLALRLLAQDKRVGAAAAFAPVTDWRQLGEFFSYKSDSRIGALSLSNYTAKLKGKPLFIAIGNADDRVSTPSCLRFYAKLYQQNLRANKNPNPTALICTDDKGHTCGALCYIKGAEFIMHHLNSEEKK